MNQKQYVRSLNESKDRTDALKYVVKQQEELLDWIINNLMTESQLDVVAPGQTKAFRRLSNGKT